MKQDDFLTNKLINEFIDFVTEIFSELPIPLHRPILAGNSKKYLIDCIESNFVSSAGVRVNDFEQMICDYTDSKYAIATISGTAALHTALKVIGVANGNEVLTQSLTFVGTANAIAYTGSSPIFIDVNQETLGMCPKALEEFLVSNVKVRKGQAINCKTGNLISACVPMHTFGIPCRIGQLKKICDEWCIPIIEDAAEALGSKYNHLHVGCVGDMGIVSFNGNKIITTGGGGAILTSNKNLADMSRHLSSTAKQSHPFEFIHDQIGYNYRMPNLNASLGCAQIENLENFIKLKKQLSELYSNFFAVRGITFVNMPSNTSPNHWLNAIKLENKHQRDKFLVETNNANVMTRPIWKLINELPMYQNCYNDGLKVTKELYDTIVCLPSSVPNSWVNNV